MISYPINVTLSIISTFKHTIMPLINCPECEKEVSNKAISCPNCGSPISPSINNAEQEHLCCPRCHSKELHSEHQGFSGGKALAGAMLVGGIGLLAGTIGNKDVQITCLKCGRKFKAGKALIINDKKESEINNELNNIIINQGERAACKYYREQTGVNYEESVEYVCHYARFNNIKSKKKSYAGIIVIIMIIIITLMMIF